MLRWTRSRDHKYDFDIFQFKDYLGVACSVHANCIKFCLKLINMSLGRVCVWWSKWNSIPRGDLRFSKNLENHYFLLVEKSQIGGNFQQFTSLCAIISQLLKAKIQSQLLIPIIEILSKELSPCQANIFDSHCLVLHALNESRQRNLTKS